MRAFLLLFLGAGLVWFVWRGLGPSGPGEVEATPSAPGAMIAVDAGPEVATESAPGTPIVVVTEPVPSATPAVANPPALANPPTLANPPAGANSGPGAAPFAAGPAVVERAPSGTGYDGEVPAANELLRDPARLESWIGVHGAELPGERREYGLGLAQALTAHGTEAVAALERAEKLGEIATDERELLRRIAQDSGASGSILRNSPLARAGSMKALERAAIVHMNEGRAQEAAEAFSRLLLAEIDSPWPADPARLEAWSANLRESQRKYRWNQRGNWPSREVVVQPGDSLIAIRKRAIAADPSLVICTGLIARANQLAGEVIHPGDKLRIPVDRASALVDLDAHWAFYLLGGEVADAWPVGVGKESSTTRVGTFVVGKKEVEPMWFPQGRPAVPYGDPGNPLGTRWISWDDAEGRSTGLGFHGTNEPTSIGKDASLGCIRMRTPDVETLFDILPVGARVVVMP